MHLRPWQDSASLPVHIYVGMHLSALAGKCKPANANPYGNASYSTGRKVQACQWKLICKCTHNTGRKVQACQCKLSYHCIQHHQMHHALISFR